MAELKPCPFCGGKARLKYGKYNLFGAYGGAENDREWAGVYCRKCNITQPPKTYSTKTEAIEAWNRRTEDVYQKKTQG